MKKHLLILTFVVMAGASVVTRAQVSSTNMEKALVGEGLTQQRAQEILGTSVPVGGIISYCLGISNLPPNWRVCDGSVVTNAQQGPFVGKAVPDLRGQFLLGAQSAATVGNKGGTNTTYSGVTVAEAGGHLHVLNPHGHDVFGFTGGIDQSINNSEMVPYGSVYNEKGWVDWSRLEVSWVGVNGKTSQGQHMHRIPSGYASATSAGGATLSAPNHTHTVNDFQAKLPPYTEVLFIVRIY